MRSYLQRKGLYRARDGLILGVCKGLARYFDLRVAWVRLAAVAALLLTGFWPAGLVYLIMGLVMKPAPALPPADEEAEEFYHSYADSRAQAVHRLRRTYSSLERRLRRLEDLVTSRDFSWEQRAGGPGPGRP
jgi:phage shock protein C